MNRIDIDLEGCDGCRRCVRACFVNVLGWNRSEGKPSVDHPEDCVHCNLCELACPGGRVRVTPDFSALDWNVL